MPESQLYWVKSTEVHMNRIVSDALESLRENPKYRHWEYVNEGYIPTMSPIDITNGNLNNIIKTTEEHLALPSRTQSDISFQSLLKTTLTELKNFKIIQKPILIKSRNRAAAMRLFKGFPALVTEKIADQLDEHSQLALVNNESATAAKKELKGR